MWAPLGNIWVILGDKKQAYLPAVRPFTHHILPSFNCVAIAASQSHLPPCTEPAQVVQNQCRAYHLFPDGRGGFCFKMFIYSTCFAVMRQIYFSFPLFQMAVWQKIIFFFYSWRSVCDIFMQNWTSGHNEQDDFCIHVCYRTRAPILHFKNTFNTTLATVSLPPPHYPLISTWKSSDELGLSRLRNVLLSNLMDWTLILGDLNHFAISLIAINQRGFLCERGGFSEALLYWPDHHCMCNENMVQEAGNLGYNWSFMLWYHEWPPGKIGGMTERRPTIN